MRANLGQIALRSSRVTSYRFPSSIFSGMPDTRNAGFRSNLQSQVRRVMPKTPSFEEIFLPHLDAAYNLARWILGTEQDAQDVVQEAFARAGKASLSLEESTLGLGCSPLFVILPTLGLRNMHQMSKG